MTTGNQTIKRSHKSKNNPYKPVRRKTFEDSRLSFEARGVLAYLLVKPDDWEMQVSDLMTQGNIGKDKTYKIINELISNGYCERIEKRVKGRFVGFDYLINEEPEAAEPDTEKPEAVEPDTEKPEATQPDTEKPDHTNKEKTTKKESLTKEEKSEGDARVDDPVASAQPQPPHPSQIDLWEEEERSGPEPTEPTEPAAQAFGEDSAKTDFPPSEPASVQADMLTPPRSGGPSPSGESRAEGFRYSLDAPPAGPKTLPAADPSKVAKPARRYGRVTSPHIDPRKFMNGYIPASMGTTAVEIYYERFAIADKDAKLSAPLEDDLVRCCPDLSRLRDVIETYSRAGHRPGNVQLILDWYNKGVPQKGTTPNASDSRSNQNSHPQTIEDRIAQLKPDDAITALILQRKLTDEQFDAARSIFVAAGGGYQGLQNLRRAGLLL